MNRSGNYNLITRSLYINVFYMRFLWNCFLQDALFLSIFLRESLDIIYLSRANRGLVMLKLSISLKKNVITAQAQTLIKHSSFYLSYD